MKIILLNKKQKCGNVFSHCLELIKIMHFPKYCEFWHSLSGLNDGFRFCRKIKSHCLGLAKTWIFPKKIRKLHFPVFLYHLAENIPDRQFLILGFSWIIRIFLLSPRIPELSKHALNSHKICSPCSVLSILRGKT